MSTKDQDAGIPRIAQAETTATDRLAVIFTKEPDLVHHVLGNLNPSDLVSLMRTSPYMRDQVVTYQAQVFKVERVMSRFMLDYTKFRRMQARTGVIVSGSVALQFFDRAFYPKSDLDLYVEHRYALEVIRFLCVHEGYTFLPTERQIERVPHNVTPRKILEQRREGVDNDYAHTGISEVINVGKGEIRVQVIVVKRAPLEVILTFHSTCVMNLITHNAAYSLFPILTLDKHISRLLPKSPSVTNPRWSIIRDKYTVRGFTFVDSMPGDFMRPLWDRWVGDYQTWTIQLPSMPAPCVHAPDTVTLNAFKMWHEPMRGSTMIFDIFRDSSLSYSYTCIRKERAMLRAVYEAQATARALSLSDGPPVAAENYDLDQSICDVVYGYRTGGADKASFERLLTPQGSSTMLVFPPGGHRMYHLVI